MVYDAFGRIGDSHFFSYGPAYGLDLSLDVTPFIVYLTFGGFHDSDFGGTGYNLNFGGGPSGFFIGGDSKGGYPADIWPNSYTTVGVGASVGAPLINFSISKTNTIVWKPTKYYPENPGLRRPGEY